MTTYDLSGSNYSETDSSNSNAAPAGMPEGMAPGGVNDAWRSHAGAVKRAYDWDHAGTWATVGGTGNAITLAYAVAPNAYVQGQKHAFKATAANSGATTVNVNSLGVKNVFKKSAAGPVACVGAEIQIGDLVEIEYDGTQFQIPGGIATVNQRIAQIVNTETGAVATGTTLMPGDDTIPTSSQGNQYMSLAITPTSSSSSLIIDAVVNLSNSQSNLGNLQVALLQDSTANSLANVIWAQTVNNAMSQIVLRHKMTAGTTSATTFKIRAGCAVAGTTGFNGVGGSGLRLGGGGLASSITITEVLP